MTLRSSYCTMMMKAYSQKRIFRNLDQEGFLMKLANVMNTSPEQLKTTYIGVDRSDFEDTAKELVSVLDISLTDNNDENREADAYESFFS